MAPSAPIFSSAPVLASKIFRTYTVPAAASQTSTLFVVTPLNDTLVAGMQQVGALSSASAPTGLFTEGLAPYLSFFLNDPIITDLITGAPTSGATNAVSYRITDLCVEISTTQALSSVSGSFKFGRWTQGAIPVLGSGLGPEWLDTVETMLALNPAVLSAADLLSPHCLHCAARSRDALAFAPSGVGYTAVVGTYGNTGTVLAGGSDTAHWDPLFILFQGTNRPELTLTFRGTIEVQPLPMTFQWRIAKMPPPVKNGAEETWWQWQRKTALNTYPINLGGSVARNRSGYVGTSGSTSSPPPRNKPSRLRTTPAPSTSQRQSQSSGPGTDTAVRRWVSGMGRPPKSWSRAIADSVVDLMTGRGALPEMVRMIQPPPGLQAIRNGSELRRRRRR